MTNIAMFICRDIYPISNSFWGLLSLVVTKSQRSLTANLPDWKKWCHWKPFPFPDDIGVAPKKAARSLVGPPSKKRLFTQPSNHKSRLSLRAKMHLVIENFFREISLDVWSVGLGREGSHKSHKMTKSGFQRYVGMFSLTCCQYKLHTCQVAICQVSPIKDI